MPCLPRALPAVPSQSVGRGPWAMQGALTEKPDQYIRQLLRWWNPPAGGGPPGLLPHCPRPNSSTLLYMKCLPAEIPIPLGDLNLIKGISLTQ